MRISAAITVVIVLATVSSALAAVVDAPAPPQSLPSVPSVPSRGGYFPALPPSSPCKSGDIVGAWRLVQVFEDPQGAETAAFSAEPVQYVDFTSDQTYKYFKSLRQDFSADSIMNSLQRTEGDSLQQFVMGDGGVIYFYREGVVADTQVCFIVSNPRGQFVPGQMLIMPPAPADGNAPSIRVAKLYTRFEEQSNVAHSSVGKNGLVSQGNKKAKKKEKNNDKNKKNKNKKKRKTRR